MFKVKLTVGIEQHPFETCQTLLGQLAPGKNIDIYIF